MEPSLAPLQASRVWGQLYFVICCSLAGVVILVVP